MHSTKGQIIHADTAEDEHPYPLVQTLEKVHKLGCHHICASLDGKVAASAGFGGEVKIWRFDAEGSEQWQLHGELAADTKRAGEQWALALSEDGRYLAVTTHEGRTNVYDTTTFSSPDAKPQRIAAYETKPTFALAVDLSPNCNMTASGHQNGQIYLFNNATQKLAHALSGLIKPVRSVRFSPASTLLAAAGDSRIIALYATGSGEQIANLTGHGSWIMSLDWNWSGEFLLSGSWDGRAKVWSIERRECVATQTEGSGGEGGGALWSVKWLPKSASQRNETFVVAGAGKALRFYREASGT